MTPRRRSTYGMPGSGAGVDDFRAKLEPRFTPVDDLSRFVADRIRDLETEPVVDGVDPLKSPGDAAAYRYAKHVRDDCVVFRKIVAQYVEPSASPSAKRALRLAVVSLAERWSDHHDFQESWRLS